MIRILLLALALTACGCTTAPIASNAQRDLDSIKSSYALAFKVESAYGALPACPWAPPCADKAKAWLVKRAEYEADAAIVTADSERTSETIAVARTATQAFVQATLELQ